MNDGEKKKDTQKCIHEARYIVYDSKEGTSICTNCTLVVGDSLCDPPSQSVSVSFLERYDNEEKLSTKAKAIGLNIDFTKQSMLLHDYVENAHLPTDLVEKTGHHSKKVLYSLEINALPKARMLRISLAEFTALMIYQTMLMERIPRSLHLVSAFSGVSIRKLNQVEKIFPTEFTMECLKPSNFMAGVEMYLPVTYSEVTHVCEIADRLQENLSHHPATILTAVIYAYLQNRSAWGAKPVVEACNTCSIKPKYISDTRWMLCAKCDSGALEERQKKKEEEYERKKKEILEEKESTKVIPPIISGFTTKIMSKRDLCNLMGISTTTLIRGMKTIIHDNDHFDTRLLSIYL